MVIFLTSFEVRFNSGEDEVNVSCSGRDVTLTVDSQKSLLSSDCDKHIGGDLDLRFSDFERRRGPNCSCDIWLCDFWGILLVLTSENLEDVCRLSSNNGNLFVLRLQRNISWCLTVRDESKIWREQFFSGYNIT